MKEQLKILFQMQQMEQQKNALSLQKAKVNSDEVRQLWQEVRLLTQTIAAEKEAKMQLERVCSQQEAALAADAKHCQEVEAKLYGGEITNLKELEQVKENCDKMRKDIASLENQTYANIEACEKIAAKVAGDEAAVQQKKRLHAEKQQLITHALADFDARLTVMESELSQLASQVEPGLLQRFRDLARRTPLPVARVDKGICGGCRMSIPTNQTALAVTVTVYCDNCGRILLVE